MCNSYGHAWVTTSLVCWRPNCAWGMSSLKTSSCLIVMILAVLPLIPRNCWLFTVLHFCLITSNVSEVLLLTEELNTRQVLSCSEHERLCVLCEVYCNCTGCTKDVWPLWVTNIKMMEYTASVTEYTSLLSVLHCGTCYYKTHYHNRWLVNLVTFMSHQQVLLYMMLKEVVTSSLC